MNDPVIEGYTELVQVAQGGFGIVYRGRREALDQDVAVKVLSLPNLSERDLDRFTRECRAAGNLSWHPHVVAVTDSGTTSTGQPYLAMEYLDNGSLADRLVADGPLPWADVVDIGIQVAGALGAAHAAGTLHRDLKPENVLVGHFGEAKLGDFGIAAVEGGARTATGHASYTVTHVAPEILRGQRPDERSDLYGLASTLFTLLTGRTPFAGDDPDEPIATIITRALTEPAPHLTGIPEPLADLLEQTLDKDPDHRPQTAQALGEALQQIQRDNNLPVTDLRLARTTTTKPAPDAAPRGDSRRTIHVGPTTPIEPEPARPEPADPNATITLSPVEPASEPETPPPPPPDPDQTPPPPPPDPAAPTPSRSKTSLLIGLAVIAVLALGAGAFFVLSGGDDSGTDLVADDGNPRTGTLTVDPGPPLIAATGDDLWVADEGDGGASRYDPSTGELDLSLDATASSPTAVAATDDGLFWLVTTSELVAVDKNADEEQVVDSFGFGQTDAMDAVSGTNCAGGALGGHVWLLDVGTTRDSPKVDCFTAATVDGPGQDAQTSIDLGGTGGTDAGLTDLAATETDLWVTTTNLDGSGDGGVIRVDPEAGEVVASIVTEIAPGSPLTFKPVAVDAGEAGVWAVEPQSGLIEINASDNSVGRTVELPMSRLEPVDVAVAGDAVWVTVASGVAKVDAGSAEVVDTIELDGAPSQIIATEDDVWVVIDDTVQHLDPT